MNESAGVWSREDCWRLAYESDGVLVNDELCFERHCFLHFDLCSRSRVSTCARNSVPLTVEVSIHIQLILAVERTQHLLVPLVLR